MDKESIYELQKLDCNCNDCIFMIRNQEKFKESLIRHEKWQKDYFELIKSKQLEVGRFHKDIKGDLEKWDMITTQAENMKFIFDKSMAKTNYGFCDKLKKDVKFIPNLLQLDTQTCFKHRKDV